MPARSVEWKGTVDTKITYQNNNSIFKNANLRACKQAYYKSNKNFVS